MSQYPLSSARLRALLGDAFHDVPPYFIEKLERRLEQYDEDNPAAARLSKLSMEASESIESESGGTWTRSADQSLACTEESVFVSVRTLQGLDAILEVLHAAHIGRRDRDPDAMLSDHLLEGLIVAGRALARPSHDVRGEA